MESLVAGRYRIERRLGQGASAVVFAARDRWLGDGAVALKTLARRDRELAGLLAREFALLFRIRHPHVARVLELGRLLPGDAVEDVPAGAPFVVEELCPGLPAARWAQGRRPALVAVVGAQMAAALAALHARGILHGDVKPDNVLVSADDEPHARLVDFNLAATGPSSTVAGTLRYMAPEAMAGRRGPASDVYALAATLAELVACAPLTAHHGAQLDCPHLGDAIAAMSHPQPERRADAAAAFELLFAHVPPALREPLLRLRDGVWADTGCVARPDVVRALDDLLSGRVIGARVLRVAGAPGSGKTAALGEVVARAATAGFLVPGSIRAAAHGELGEIERVLAELGAPGEAAENSARTTTSHADSLPVAAELRSTRWQRFAALADALGQATAEQPVAIVLDDVPPGSPLDELGGFLERLEERGPRVLWAQASAPTAPFVLRGAAEESDAGAFNAATAGNAATDTATSVAEDSRTATTPATNATPGSARARTVCLCPLGVEAVTEIIRAGRPLRPVDLDAAEALHAASGGVPQAIATLLAAYPGDALLRAAQDGQLSQAGALADAAGRRLSQLAGAGKWLVTAVALLDPPVSVSLLSRLPGLGGEPLAALFEQASSLGLLRDHATSDGPALSVPAEALRASVAAGASRELLSELTALLVAESPSPRRAAALGRLYTRLGEPALAAPYLLESARHAARALRTGDALRAYDMLLELTALAPAPREAALIESGGLCIALGRGGEALARFERAGDHPQARVIRAEALLSLGRYRDAAAALAGEPQVGEDVAAAEALAARALLLAGEHDAALGRAKSALARTSPHPREPELVAIEGLVAFYGGDAASAKRMLESACRLAAAREDPALLDKTRANLALVMHKSGEPEAAEQAYLGTLTAARSRRDLARQLLTLPNLAALREEQGRFDEALAGYQEAHDLARLVGGRRELVRVALNRANLLCWLGDAPAACGHVQRAISEALELGMKAEQAYLWLVLAEVHLGLGSNEAAVVAVDAARELFAGMQDKAGLAETDAVAAEVALHRRDARAARQSAEAAVLRARDAGRARIEARALVWRAMADLEEPSAALEAGLGAAVSAAGLAEKLGDADLAWLGHAAACRLHARAGRPHEARLHASKAREAAQRARSRLSARYERGWAAVWYRRDLWSSLEQAGGAPAEQPGRDLDRVLAINRELARDHDPDRLLERIIDAAIALSGAERGFVLLSSGAQADAEISIRAARNIDRESLEAGDLNVSRSIALEAMASGTPLNSVNAVDDHRFREVLSVHNLKLRSVLCLPLRAHNGVLGALYLDNRYRVNAFSDADVALLAAFGDQAAIALANARLVSELDRRSRELERSRAEVEELNQRLARELEARSAELELARAGGGGDGETGLHGMIGRSARMREVFRVIDRVADKQVPVTILGESGTGKELVARAIHAASPRARGPFVSVNCGAIPAELLESELFGHERGAFTGAVRSKPGLFEVARGGTLFLDEIGDMPLGMQVKLLRVLQQKELRRVGGTEVIATDARVLSASNQELQAMVLGGRFREDLWYRLNVVEIHVPPLRARREDLPLLVEHFLGLHGGTGAPRLHREALALLLDHDWPGNVRELENEIQRAVALSDGEIGPSALSAKLRRAGAAGYAAAGTLKDTVERFERATITAALEAHQGRVAAAARALGLTRAGLYKKIHKYELNADTEQH